MKHSVIAFVSQLNQVDQLRWIDVLSIKLPHEIIKQAHTLSDEEKQHCEIAIVANPNPDVVLQFPNLQWIQSLWAGVEGLVKAFKNPSENKIPFKIARLIDPNLSQTMSEAVLSWVLYLHRDMPKYLAQQQEGLWLQQDYILPKERTIGILGLGALGKSSALRLQQNNFNVLGWSKTEKSIPEITCFSGAKGLVELVSLSNILVCLLPLTQETYHLIDTDLLHQLSKGSSIINFSRGAIICSDSLLQTLDDKHIEHAVLDVFDQEPLNTDSPFWLHKNITVLPHISAPTHIHSASIIVTHNINNYRKYGQFPPCIDLNRGY